MVKIGHLLKYSENLSASNVADVTMTFRSGLRFNVFFSNPKSTSVAIVRSCASSSIITEYRFKSGSRSTSRCNIPSVIYLIFVSGLVQSSNLMV